jgi:hypothetical protein
VTIQEPLKVTCCKLLALVSQIYKQLKCKGVFSTSATSVHCWILPGISYFLNLQNEFRGTFPDFPVSGKSTISRVVNHFCYAGSMQDGNRFGRLLVLSDNSLGDIHQTLSCYLWKSLRKFSLQRGIYYGSVHKATEILKLHPYHVYISCMNLSNLERESSFSTEFGLDTSFKGV